MSGTKRKNVHPLGPPPRPTPPGRKLASALRPALLSGVCSGSAPLLRPSPQLFPLYPGPRVSSKFQNHDCGAEITVRDMRYLSPPLNCTWVSPLLHLQGLRTVKLPSPAPPHPSNFSFDPQRLDSCMDVSMDVRVVLQRKLSTKELMLLNCGVGEDSQESLGL